jgi:hypothetical protein
MHAVDRAQKLTKRFQKSISEDHAFDPTSSSAEQDEKGRIRKPVTRFDHGQFEAGKGARRGRKAGTKEEKQGREERLGRKTKVRVGTGGGGDDDDAGIPVIMTTKLGPGGKPGSSQTPYASITF